MSDQDSGDEIGPVHLPGLVAPIQTPTKTAEETRREWELVKAGMSLADANKPLERDSWMTELPTGNRASLNFGQMQKSVTRFSRREYSEKDDSWTAMPGQEGEKEKPKVSLSLAKQMAKEAAENFKREKYGSVDVEEKKPSLLEIHLQKIENEKEEKEKEKDKRKKKDKDRKHSKKRKRSKDKKDKKHKKDKDRHKSKKRKTEKDKEEPAKPAAYWDRDRDLIISQNDPKRRAKLLQSAAGLSSRFESKGYL